MARCNEDCFNCIYPECICTTTEQVREYKRRDYQKNKEKYIARARQWEKDHPERAKELLRSRQKRYREKHKEKIAEYMREYVRKKKEKVVND